MFISVNVHGSRRKLFDIDLITHCYSAVSENRLTLVPILFSFSVESAMATSSQSHNVPVGAPVSVGPLSALFEEVETDAMANQNPNISVSESVANIGGFHQNPPESTAIPDGFCN